MRNVTTFEANKSRFSTGSYEDVFARDIIVSEICFMK